MADELLALGPVAVACPWCGADRMDWCRKRSGGLYRTRGGRALHRARVKRWKVLARATETYWERVMGDDRPPTILKAD